MLYDDKYFLGDYRSQYGKTYEEDKDNLYALASRRLDEILKIWKHNTGKTCKSLMDLGSALGFFLKTAYDSGIKNLLGVEISGYAAGYCKNNFNIPVINSSFNDAEIPKKSDIITAWYFLEHCEDPLEAVSRIYNLLEPDGIFAFSTPSFFGPLFVFNRAEWARLHPSDHRIDFSPKTVRRFLKKAGFRRIIIKISGVHPERILSRDSFFYMPFSLIYSEISRIFKFSDTIEVFAIK